MPALETPEKSPEMKFLETELTKYGDQLKGYFEKAAEETKLNGSSREETKTAIQAITQKLEAIQTQTDAIDVKLAKRFSESDPDRPRTLGEQFVESKEYKEQQDNKFLSMRSKEGRVRVPISDPFSGRKTNITTGGLGTGTTGVQMPQRLPGITPLPRQELRIRDLMNVIPMTTGNSFDYVQMQSRTNNASPQVEAATKGESTYTWNSLSGTVKTIAHFTNVSRQALDDVPWMRAMIDSELMYGLLLEEEREILSGDGTGVHLNGLMTQATAYNPAAFNMTGDTKLDILRHAKLQARLYGLATFAPDGIVLNPFDMEKIELIKEENGGSNRGLYIIGDPRTGTAVKFLWNLPVVESDSIAQNTFLVGAFGTAAQLIDRMQAMVEISYEHASNFTANLATILAEERIGLANRVPGAFITGTFGTTSP